MINGKIKALMKFDYYSMKVLYITIAVMIVSGSFVALGTAAATGKAVTGMNGIMCSIATVLLSTVFAYDNYKGIGSYRRAMPFEIEEHVRSRYMPAVFLAAFSVVIQLLMTIAGLLIHGSTAEGFSGQLGAAMVFIFFYSSVFAILFYPLVYKFGYRKLSLLGGIIGMIIMFSGLAISVASLLIVYADDDINYAEDITFIIPLPVAVLIMIALIVLYYLSYKLSVRFAKTSDEWSC